MTAKILAFPNFFRFATPLDEPCLILVLPVVRIERECPKIAELRRNTRRLCKNFNWQFSGGTCSGGEG